MSLDSNFAQLITKKLSGLKANNINQAGALNFGSLSQLEKTLPLFEQSAQNIGEIDYQAIAQALQEGNLDGITNEGTQSIATVMNELLAMQEISDLADVSEDGEIDAAELEALIAEIAQGDGDKTNLTMEDVDALLEKMGIDVDKAVENAIEEALKEVEEQKAEEVEEAKKEEAAQETQQTSNAAPSSSSGGNSGVSGARNSQNTNNSKEITGDSVEEIEAAIEAKNEEIEGIEADAEAQIAEQEKQKEAAMKQAGVSEQEYKEYQEKEQELETKIKDTDSQITEKENLISDKQSTKASNESYIGSLESQIAANEQKQAAISDDDENASSKRAEVSSQIANLQAEKDRLVQENAKLQQDIAKAEEEKARLHQTKESLENQKAELLNSTLDSSKGFAKGVGSTEAVSDIKAQIAEYDNNIKEIRAEKDSKIDTIQGEIQTLQTQLKEAQAKEEREAFLKENNFKVGLGLTGEELVDVAREMLDKYGETHGWCATGVSRTMEMAYGIKMNGNGCDWDSNMDNLVAQGAFEEITGDYPSEADLANLPAGAVICWEATGGDSGGAKYGHVTIADGKGGEISDHYSDHIYTHLKSYKVYYPVS